MCSNCGQPLAADLEASEASGTADPTLGVESETTIDAPADEPPLDSPIVAEAEAPTDAEQPQEDPMSAQGTPASEEHPAREEPTATTAGPSSFARPDVPTFGEAADRVRRFFSFSGNRPEVYLRIAATGLILVLLSMLADSAGLAILVGLFIIPVLILRYLSAIDLFEREPWWGIGGAAGAGLLGGLVIGGLGHYLVDQLWIDNAPLRVGAAGFAGTPADKAGAAPFSVLFLCGLILPALAEVVKLAVPVYMRQWPVFRNEVMDGITLGAAGGGAFAAGTAIVHFWPVIVRGDSVDVGLSEWTGMILGLAVVRPLIQMAITALLGAAIWQYSLSQSTQGLTLPIAAGAGGAIFYGLSDIIVQPIGTTFELFWSCLVAVVLLYFLRVVIRQALSHDAMALGASGQRVVCPNCHRVTPVGAFCAICGAPLGTSSPAAANHAF